MSVLAKPPKPVAPPVEEGNLEADLEHWKQDPREQFKEGNMSAIHAVVWGQCSDAMKAKRKSLTMYEAKTK